MFVLGVTGGIGSGKSAAARLFRTLGAVVIDLDDLAKPLLAKGGPLVEAVAAAFGRGIVASDGGVDPRVLAARAFASAGDARRLDALVHPAVFAACAGALDALVQLPEPPEVVVIDIPLLVEAPMFFDLLDAVLAISADEDTRVSRLVANGWDASDVRARIAVQASDVERRDIAEYVVENDGTLEQFESDLRVLWERVVESRGA